MEFKNETLKDVISENLVVLIVGETVGKESFELQTYYASSNNQFRKIICEYFLQTDVITPDYSWKLEKLLIENRIGLTDICKHKVDGKNITASIKDCLKFIDELKQKIKKYKPQIVVFNGKCGKLNKSLLNKFFNTNNDLYFGKQDYKLDECNTTFYILPSTSNVAQNINKIKSDFVKPSDLSGNLKLKCWQKMAEIYKNILDKK